MLLKTNLHFHTNDDPVERAFIKYNSFEAVDEAAAKGFEVLAFTLHNLFHFPAELVEYAKGKNILLIPGIEKTIEGRHVLILNADKSSEQIETFADLTHYRAVKKDIFVIAPHPFFYGNISLKEKLAEHFQLFDAIEHSWFYTRFFNRNKQGEKLAKQYGLPFVALSDTHKFCLLENSYAVIDAKEKTTEAVFEAIRARAFENKTKPASFYEIFSVLWTILFNAGELSIRKTFSAKNKVSEKEESMASEPAQESQ